MGLIPGVNMLDQDDMLDLWTAQRTRNEHKRPRRMRCQSCDQKRQNMATPALCQACYEREAAE